MRRIDWLLLLVCLSGSLCAGTIAYRKGVVAGRQEAEHLFAVQVRALEQLTDQSEIRAMLEEVWR